jgi:hypothetical protein
MEWNGMGWDGMGLDGGGGGEEREGGRAKLSHRFIVPCHPAATSAGEQKG